jgi:hypothetical protein
MLPFFNEQELLKPSDLIHDTKEYPFSIIITWQRQILEAVARNYKLKEISTFRCGVACPVYEFKAKRESIGIVLLPIGAPVVAGFLEEYIVRNVMRFVCIGYAGSLSEKTGDLLVVPSRAYRDERVGSSFRNAEVVCADGSFRLTEDHLVSLELYVIDSKENNSLAVVTYIGCFLELNPHLVLIKGEGLDVYLEIVPQCCYACGVKVQAAVIF